MIKSPLRYPGGKSRAINIISSLLPSYGEFREPFAGGASVFIYAQQCYPDRKYWINDIYTDLYKFWDYAQKDISSLIDRVYAWKNRYANGRELFSYLNNNFESFSDLEQAAAFFVYNRITFSGTTLSGGFSPAAFTSRFTDSSICRLEMVSEVLRDARITNCDYSELVNADGEDVFIFLDPPYYSATKSALYGKKGDLHKKFDHVVFAETMRNCKHKWLITYDDCDYIRELFDFAYIEPWNLTYGMRNVNKDGDQKGKELFISNFPIECKNTQSDIMQLRLF
ncbi:MAG: DNA adenine methylase [Rikenellaceae bacterium]